MALLHLRPAVDVVVGGVRILYDLARHNFQSCEEANAQRPACRTCSHPPALAVRPKAPQASQAEEDLGHHLVRRHFVGNQEASISPPEAQINQQLQHLGLNGQSHPKVMAVCLAVQFLQRCRREMAHNEVRQGIVDQVAACPEAGHDDVHVLCELRRLELRLRRHGPAKRQVSAMQRAGGCHHPIKVIQHLADVLTDWPVGGIVHVPLSEHSGEPLVQPPVEGVVVHYDALVAQGPRLFQKLEGTGQQRWQLLALSQREGV